MKKLLALTLALLLVVLLLPTTALAEENEYVIENKTQNIKYKTVCSALRGAKDKDTLVLLQNCEATDDSIRDTLSVEVGDAWNGISACLDLDLAGYMLEMKDGIFVQDWSTFTISNSKPDTGGIIVTVPMGTPENRISAFSTGSGSKTILDRVKITGETGVELIDYSSGASCEIKNCNITWRGDCIYIDSYSILLQNTEIKLTESGKNAINYRCGGSITIDNCKITGAGANLLISTSNANVPTMGISIASDDWQNGFIDLKKGYQDTFVSGGVSLPGVENAGEKLKGMMNAQISNEALLVTGFDGLYIGNAAWECLDDVKSGETYTIEQAGTPEQMAEFAKAGAVCANGCTIKNGTNEDITVNEVVIQPGGSYTFTEKGPELDPELDPPSTIVIIRPAEEETTQPNPATGAPQVIAVAAAASAIAAVLAAVLLLRRKEE